MGLVYADIELINIIDVELAKKHIIGEEEIKRMHLNMLADIGAFMMSINENIQSILQLPFIEKRKAILADGTIAEYNTVGPIMVKLKIEQLPAMHLYFQEIPNLCWEQYQWRKWMY